MPSPKKSATRSPKRSATRSPRKSPSKSVRKSPSKSPRMSPSRSTTSTLSKINVFVHKPQTRVWIIAILIVIAVIVVTYWILWYSYPEALDAVGMNWWRDEPVVTTPQTGSGLSKLDLQNHNGVINLRQSGGEVYPPMNATTQGTLKHTPGFSPSLQEPLYASQDDQFIDVDYNTSMIAEASRGRVVQHPNYSNPSPLQSTFESYGSAPMLGQSTMPAPRTRLVSM